MHKRNGHIARRSSGRIDGYAPQCHKEIFRMRRLAPLGLLLAMTGCGQYASSPFVGFGDFVGQTHTINRNPNRPLGDTDNMRRVEGLPASSEPLVPEPGNVWPGPLPPEMTLQDVARANPDEMLKPGEELDLGHPRGSGTPPPGTFQPNPSNTPAADSSFAPRPTPPAQPAPRSSTLQTPSGPAALGGSGAVRTYTTPSGATGIVIPNANGTSTLVAPDGTVQTVPSPK